MKKTEDEGRTTDEEDGEESVRGLYHWGISGTLICAEVICKTRGMRQVWNSKRSASMRSVFTFYYTHTMVNSQSLDQSIQFHLYLDRAEIASIVLLIKKSQETLQAYKYRQA